MWSEETIRALAPWAEVAHAYGPAVDLPERLAALLSTDDQIRLSAHEDLRWSIIHQESRYSASPRVVPFLTAIAREVETPNRPWVLELLGMIALGDDISWMNCEDTLDELRLMLAQEPDAERVTEDSPLTTDQEEAEDPGR